VRVVIGAGQEDLAREALDGLDVGELILGAEERALSVANGLNALPAGATIVLIHDAARPFCPPEVIDRLLDALEGHAAAVPVLRAADTLARLDGAVLGERLDRDQVARVQTPQAFKLSALREAIEAWDDGVPTDESAYLQACGVDVAAVEGHALLEKLTTGADWARAEAMLAARTSVRTGMGFDVHAFEPGDHLWIGGVQIPHGRALKGHSDADVGLHALTDALLGAIAAGDIGDHFPPSDPQWKGAPSPLFLEHARTLVEQAGGVIEHVDVTIICEAPKIGPHREAMRARIADLLRLPVERVSVKATTTERLGFTGRGEGIAAQAIATVRVEDRF
jgi:2-C-methyl-D-erythritol 4-phosphate cytidylyltransferase/2-C-methyl-D-erythritol 2,4-cyclodiphosphate synthase